MQEPVTETVIQITPENFQSVVERSQQTPVVLLFWAEPVAPSAQTRQQLEALVVPYAGKLVLGLVDVSQDQTLAQHLRVQGLPSVRVIQGGQIVEQLDGPQPENQYKELFDRLTLSSADVLRAQLEQLLATGDYDRALALLQEAVNEEPNNSAFRVELADLLVLRNELDDAKQVLASIAAESEGLSRPQTRLALAEEAAQLPNLADLQAQHQTQPDDLELRYQLVIRLASSGDFESALEHALVILQTDREFRDDIGRATMVRIFEVLGKGSEIAKQYRRRMFNFMH